MFRPVLHGAEGIHVAASIAPSRTINVARRPKHWLSVIFFLDTLARLRHFRLEHHALSRLLVSHLLVLCHLIN